MAKVNVISVNPGQTTLGALNREVAEKLLNAKPFIPVMVKRPVKHPAVDYILGLKGMTSAYASRRLLFARIMLGLAVGYYSLSLSGFSILSFSLESIVLLTVAVSILLGMLLRPVSLAGGGLSIYYAVTQFMAGVEPVGAVFVSLVFLMAAVLGPGSYSIDGILRKAVFKMRKRNKEKRIERMMSYQAYQLSQNAI